MAVRDIPGRPEEARRRYLRPPAPLFFPDEELVPETGFHLRIRTALFLVLERELRGRAFVSSDPEGLRCDALGAYWTVIPDAALVRVLRLARNPDGTDLWLTPDERIAELERELEQRR
jgi:hypothetical protein